MMIAIAMVYPSRLWRRSSVSPGREVVLGYVLASLRRLAACCFGAFPRARLGADQLASIGSLST